MTTESVDPDLTPMIYSVLADRHDHSTVDCTRASWDRDFWSHLGDLGLTDLTAPESRGGSGAGWPEAAVMLSASAWHGVRVPYAEHDLLAGWLVDTTGLPADKARRTVAVVDAGGSARAVPWAAESDQIVLVRGAGDCAVVRLAEPAELSIIKGSNRIGEPRDHLMVPDTLAGGVEADASILSGLHLRGSLARAIQTCSALERTVQITLTHVSERTQFGRPLAKFQAIAHLIADMAAEASLARAATEAALAEVSRTQWSGENVEFLIAVARSCSGHAASQVTRHAHQALGAIGTTQEHSLHLFTQAALTWRSEFGSLSSWDTVLTRAAINAGRAGLWGLITS